MDAIGGYWKGTLISDDGRANVNFAFRQPFGVDDASRPTLSVDNAEMPAQLLDGADHSFVAMSEVQDARPESFARLLLDARVLGDRLVGRWWRSDREGHVIGTGRLLGARA